MKILFIRHGESTDDLTNRFGGWGDFPLTDHGRNQIKDKVEAVRNLNEEFRMIYHSPLMRAKETAEILSGELNLPIKEYLYLKEHNSNGLLSGLNRDDARAEYPELTDLVGTGQVIPGAEPLSGFQNRVAYGIERLVKNDGSIICVTHGGVMRTICNNILKKNFEKAHDGGFILVEFQSLLSENNILAIDGIDFN